MLFNYKCFTFVSTNKSFQVHILSSEPQNMLHSIHHNLVAVVAASFQVIIRIDHKIPSRVQPIKFTIYPHTVVCYCKSKSAQNTTLTTLLVRVE